jgi:steroid delta-isomerase
VNAESAPTADALRATLREYIDAIAALDPERIAATFAANGELEDPVGSDVYRGRDTIRAYFANGLARMFTKLEIDVVAAWPAGSRIAAYWTMRARDMAGNHGTAEGIDVLHVNARGEIVRSEGYWDPAAFRASLTRSAGASAGLSGRGS